MCECDSDLVSEYLGSSFVIIRNEGEVRCWLCACVFLFLSLSLQLLVVSSIVLVVQVYV